MARPRKKDPPKVCRWCKHPMERKRFNGRLEDRNVFLRRRFCSHACFGLASRVPSPTISAIRSRVHRLKLKGSICEICGDPDKLGVHHKDENPANNEPTNIQTLC